MKRIFFLLIAVSLFAACSKESENPENPDGGIIICYGPPTDSAVYTGTFERSSIAGLQTANVTLKFNGNVFVGSSSKNLFPAIGAGTFTTTSNSVTFKNQMVWTANFDWTLILDGNFDASINGDSLKLTRFRGYDAVDTYYLKRQ